MLDSSGELKETEEEFSWETSMKTAIHVGLSLEAYHEMTPYELALHIETWQEQKEYDNINQLSMVWLGEYYHRIKMLPPLKKAIDEAMGKGKKAMSDEEMLAKAKSLNALFGGIEIKEPIENESIREENETDSIQSGVD